ncbi:hypothetical protein VNI00_012323 [Paramarasmius palmivorus]|uniref:Uncharacterized protein n=1 Tax=Paramarasmius palmivorus TaxID=297713 RepID=A0AAW0C592_9AGAR
MDNNITQPLLNDVSGTPLHIADPHVQHLVLLIRTNLDKIHWHNGRVRAHQQKVDQHMELVDKSAKDVEVAFGSLLEYFSTPLTQSEAHESDPGRRESYSTALTRSSTPETTYTDVSYDNLVRNVNLTPNGGHTKTLEEDKTNPVTSTSNKAIQTEEHIGTTITAPAEGWSIVFKDFQTFSRTGPLHPFAYSGTLPMSSISGAVPPSSSQPRPRLETMSTRSAIAFNMEPPTPTEKGKEKQTQHVYLVLTGHEGSIHLNRTQANKAAKAQGNPALTFLSRHEAQLALSGCIASRLVDYLADAKYERAWFTVLKGTNPGVCNRSGLLRAIGNEHLKDLTSDDIVPAFTEKEAEDIYYDRRNMYDSE